MDGIGAVSIVEFHVDHGVSTGCVIVPGRLGKTVAGKEKVPIDVTSEEDAVVDPVPDNVCADEFEIKGGNRVEETDAHVLCETGIVWLNPVDKTDAVETVSMPEEFTVVVVDWTKLVVVGLNEVVLFRDTSKEV